jgi:hypothetical protein
LQGDVYPQSPCAPRAIWCAKRVPEGEQTSQPGAVVEPAGESGLLLRFPPRGTGAEVAQGPSRLLAAFPSAVRGKCVTRFSCVTRLSSQPGGGGVGGLFGFSDRRCATRDGFQDLLEDARSGTSDHGHGARDRRERIKRCPYRNGCYVLNGYGVCVGPSAGWTRG